MIFFPQLCQQSAIPGDLLENLQCLQKSVLAWHGLVGRVFHGTDPKQDVSRAVAMGVYGEIFYLVARGCALRGGAKSFPVNAFVGQHRL